MVTEAQANIYSHSSNLYRKFSLTDMIRLEICSNYYKIVLNMASLSLLLLFISNYILLSSF